MGAGSRATSTICPTCRKHFTLPPTGRGRPPEYCGKECRATAANARKREGRARGRDTPDGTTPADVILTLATSLAKAYHRGDAPRQLNHLHEQLRAENDRLAHQIGEAPRPSSPDPHPTSPATPPSPFPPDDTLAAAVADPFDPTVPVSERSPDHHLAAAQRIQFAAKPDTTATPPTTPPPPTP
ncbi:hypothetical protein ACIRL2_49460 [Embleya sp. NPDC127516]|uniref:hypothetical protein n=1 Tax=Embleya sp. NPDC127516 TaxID=3363990 RepID=UPI0037F9681E